MEYKFKNGSSISIYYLSSRGRCRKLFCVCWGDEVIDPECSSWAEAKELALAYKG